eukprot:268995-Amphidinium_carterae.1
METAGSGGSIQTKLDSPCTKVHHRQWQGVLKQSLMKHPYRTISGFPSRLILRAQPLCGISKRKT